MDRNELLAFLPVEIVNTLKRKASRDPSSRFAAKLHTLLSYSASHPGLEDRIGCAWVNDEEFRINKQTLGRVMGIKVNSLNVDLHAHDFQQRKYHKEGWTLWAHHGFTRNSMDSATAEQPFQVGRRGPVATFNLGMSTPEMNERFTNIVRQIWCEILPNVPTDTLCPWQRLVEATAMRFKQAEQPIKNAIAVMEAILAPSGPTMLSFTNFGKVMAMFGPESTMMQKIASLLTCSNESGQWLCFGKLDPHTMARGIYGTFDDNEPNCLVIRQTGRDPIRVWNMPLIEVGQRYVIDEHGEMYESWDDYFRRNPVNRDDTPSFGLAY